MKKIFTFIIASFVATSMFAQQPLNASFENWSAGPVGELPDGWDGLNMDIGFGITVETVTKSDIAPQDGIFSTILTTVDNSIAGVLPGIITLGTIDLAGQTINGGMPYTERPDQLTGYYKFAPAGGDTALVGLAFYSAGDTIAEVGIEITAGATEWTAFSIDITYTSGANPDTLNIICMSTSNENPNEGTILEIDNLELVGGTLGVNEIAETIDFNISPNPANSFVNVNINNVNNDVKIVLHNTVGQKIYSNYYSNSSQINERIDISEFNAGIYFIEVINGDNSSIKKLIIK